MKFSCIDPVSFASMKKIDEEFMIFDRFMYIDRWSRNEKPRLIGISRNLWFWWKFTVLIKSDSQYIVCSHMCDLHNELLDPQEQCGQSLFKFDQSGKDFKENSRYNEFVTTPGGFYLNFPKIMIFDDLGKAIMNILDLRVPDDPGRWVGAVRCRKRDLEHSRSGLSSKSTLLIILQGIRFNQHSRDSIIKWHHRHPWNLSITTKIGSPF